MNVTRLKLFSTVIARHIWSGSAMVVVLQTIYTKSVLLCNTRMRNGWRNLLSTAMNLKLRLQLCLGVIWYHLGDYPSRIYTCSFCPKGNGLQACSCGSLFCFDHGGLCFDCIFEGCILCIGAHDHTDYEQQLKKNHFNWMKVWGTGRVASITFGNVPLYVCAKPESSTPS